MREPANRITPPVPQEPPPGLMPAVAIVRGASPLSATVRSRPLAKKPSALLVGAQKGRAAPSVPAMARASPVSSVRTHRRMLPDSSSWATNARYWLSGETTAPDTIDVPSGAGTTVRTAAAIGSAVPRLKATMPAIASTATAAVAHAR